MSYWSAEQRIPSGLALPRDSGADSVTIEALFPPFEAFARILNPARSSEGKAMRWSDISRQPIMSQTTWKETKSFEVSSRSGLVEPATGSIDPAVTTRLIELLTPRTEDPDNCYFLVWEGYSDLLEGVRMAPRVLVSPHSRPMHVLQGRLRNAGCSIETAEDGRGPMWWIDAGGAWCVGNDIYAKSIYVGASKETIDAILEDTELEGLAVDAQQKIVFDTA